MKKQTNEEIYKNFKLKKVIWCSYLLFSLTTIVLSVLSLIIKLNIIYPIISGIIMIVLSKYRKTLTNKK